MTLPLPLSIFYTHEAQYQEYGMVENACYYESPPQVASDTDFYNLTVNTLREDEEGVLLIVLRDVEVHSLVSHPLVVSSTCSVQSAKTIFERYLVVLPLAKGRAFETRVFTFSKRGCTIDETYPTIDRIDISADNAQLRINDYAPIVIIQQFPVQQSNGAYISGHISVYQDAVQTSLLTPSTLAVDSVSTIIRELPAGQGRCTLLSGLHLFNEPTNQSLDPYRADEVIVQTNDMILVNDLRVGLAVRPYEINYPNIDQLYARKLIKAYSQIQIIAPGRGFFPSRYIDRSMVDIDPYTIGLGLLTACANEDREVALCILLELVDYAKKHSAITYDGQNPIPSPQALWGFPSFFSSDPDAADYHSRYKPVLENAWLGFSVCHALKYLQDTVPIGEYKLYGSYVDLPGHLKALLKSMAYLVAYSVSPVQGWCAERLDMDTFNYSNLSLDASFMASVFLSEYLELDYDFFIHSQASTLYLRIDSSPVDIRDPSYLLLEELSLPLPDLTTEVVIVPISEVEQANRIAQLYYDFYLRLYRFTTPYAMQLSEAYSQFVQEVFGAESALAEDLSSRFYTFFTQANPITSSTLESVVAAFDEFIRVYYLIAEETNDFETINEQQLQMLTDAYYDFFQALTSQTEAEDEELLELYRQLYTYFSTALDVEAARMVELFYNFYTYTVAIGLDYAQSLAVTYGDFYKELARIMVGFEEQETVLDNALKRQLQIMSYRSLWEAKYGSYSSFKDSCAAYESLREALPPVARLKPIDEFLQLHLYTLAQRKYGIIPQADLPIWAAWAEVDQQPSYFYQYSQLGDYYSNTLVPDLHPTAWCDLTSKLYPLFTTPAFNLYAQSARAEATSDLQLARRMWGYGQFWTTAEKEQDIHSNIGSMLYAESQTYEDWYLLYHLLRDSTSVTRAQGPALDSWVRALYLSMGLSSDFFRRSWLSIYLARDKDTLDALTTGIRRLYGRSPEVSPPIVKNFNRLEDRKTYPDNFDSYDTDLTEVRLPGLTADDYITITFRPGPETLVPREVPGFTYLDITCDEMAVNASDIYRTNFNVTSTPEAEGYVKQGPVLVMPLAKFFPVVRLQLNGSPPDGLYEFINSTVSAGVKVEVQCETGYIVSAEQ